MEIAKEFLPDNLTEQLFKLGFPQHGLLGYYGKNGRYDQYTTGILWQQAFRWFREKHHLHGLIEYDLITYDVVILSDNTGETTKLVSSLSEHTPYLFTDYEEAQLACIQQLIKLVKDGK